MTRSTAPSAPVSITAILLLILGCAMLALYWVPSKRSLLQKQIHDGRTERALATLRSISLSERAKDPAFYALMELRLERQQLKPDQTETILPQLAAACRASQTYGYRADFNQEILARLALLPKAYRQCEREFAPFLPSMPEELQQKIYRSLTAAALADDQPAAAALIYAGFFNRFPSSETTAAQAVRLWQSAGRPDLALAAIDRFAAAIPTPLNRASPALALARVQLLRQTGRPDAAFRAALALSPTSFPSAANWFDLLLSAAREAGRTRDLLPQARGLAEANPSDPLAWKTLGDLAQANAQLDLAIQAHKKLAALASDPGPEYVKIAQFYEWSGRPQLAFDYYLKALAQRQPKAIPRLFALNGGLYRDAELAQALTAAQSLLALPDRLRLARLQSRLGHFDTAAQIYRGLCAAPNAPLAWRLEYGRLLIDRLDYSHALKLFEHAKTLAPSNPTCRRALAELHFRLGQYSDALREYQTLARLQPQDDTLEDYVITAASLARPELAEEALAIKLKTSSKVGPSDYQRLAYYQRLQGKTDQQRQTLYAGASRFPRDPQLSLLAAYAASDAGDCERAIRWLQGTPGLESNAKAARLYLTLLVGAQRFQIAQQFSAKIDPAEFNDPEMLECKAQLEEANGHPSAAAVCYRKLCASDPSDPNFVMGYVRVMQEQGKGPELQKFMRPYLTNAAPAFCTIAAQYYAAVGQFAKAAACQRRYLASRPKDAPRAWGYLGDILESHHEPSKAREAFRRSLTLLLRRRERTLSQSQPALPAFHESSYDPDVPAGTLSGVDARRRFRAANPPSR